MSKKNKNSIKRNDESILSNSVKSTAAEVSDILCEDENVEVENDRPAWMPPEGYDAERDADIRYKIKHGKKRKLKNRIRAGKLAGNGGVLGLHKFYLGKPLLGVLYIILALLTWGVVPIVLGIIESSAFFSMGDEEFNEKYNKDKMI